MANELNLPLSPDQTGLTVTAILIQANAAVGSPISCPESGTLAGHYSGNMPSVAAGVYGVRFLSAGSQVGTGVIDWDGTKERGLGDLPTVAQLEARTLTSADYFNPATDTVATVTSITNAVVLPSIPSNWITAAGLATDAVIAIQSGLATESTAAAILEDTGTTLPGLIADVPTVAEFNARTLPSADYFVVGDYTAPPTTEAIWTHTTRTLTSTALSAADVWGYSGRTLDGTQAANLAAIASIPTNPLLTTDARLNTLDAAISTRLAALSYTEPLTILETASAVEDALTAYGAATPASVWGYTGRALDGAQATALSTIVNIPTNPLLANDSRLDTLVALAQADEVISPTQYRKLTAGTNTAILTKAVTNDGVGNIQLRAAP